MVRAERHRVWLISTRGKNTDNNQNQAACIPAPHSRNQIVTFVSNNEKEIHVTYLAPAWSIIYLIEVDSGNGF